MPSKHSTQPHADLLDTDGHPSPLRRESGVAACLLDCSTARLLDCSLACSPLCLHAGAVWKLRRKKQAGKLGNGQAPEKLRTPALTIHGAHPVVFGEKSLMTTCSVHEGHRESCRHQVH
ncbi:uncharacterized protein UV8b_02602 [Ustilaginoidea virens]|uniref:Uncharacterized protein n=1 Tax=Ustilaginoidea virens TaxID=1159556 RepID=A0A8E5MFY7_USTVR|nr:uncharacterized protein UV8b_02602 [Ustilaginoidea virens]QUC18361.1 hypothetical protein UV8b_02602 [Ustilaginoidea virens]